MVLLLIMLKKTTQFFNFLGWRLRAVGVRGAPTGEGVALFAKEGPAGWAALGSLIPECLTGFKCKLGPLLTSLEP